MPCPARDVQGLGAHGAPRLRQTEHHGQSGRRQAAVEPTTDPLALRSRQEDWRGPLQSLRRARACSCRRNSGRFMRLAHPPDRGPERPGPARSSGRQPPHRRAPARGAETPLLVDQGTGVVPPEPHCPAAAGQPDALLDLVFAQGGGHAPCCRADPRYPHVLAGQPIRGQYWLSWSRG